MEISGDIKTHLSQMMPHKLEYHGTYNHCGCYCSAHFMKDSILKSLWFNA